MCKDLNKWKHTVFMCQNNINQMVALSRLRYRFNADPIRIPTFPQPAPKKLASR